MKLPNQSLTLLFLLPLVSASPLLSNRSSGAFTRSKRQPIRRSSNYAGVQQTPPPDGTTFSYITGVINIPEPQYVPSHGPAPTLEYATAWIGFGPQHFGPPGDSGIMQTGCGWFNDGEEDQAVRCWYEFAPARKVDFASGAGFSPAPGGQIGLEIWRNSATQGRARLTDLGAGGAVSATFSAPEGYQVNGQMAEWIVEDPNVNGEQAALVDFGTVTFSGAYATTSGGNTYPPFTDGYYSEIYMIISGVSQAIVATSDQTPGGNVVVNYVGPTS